MDEATRADDTRAFREWVRGLEVSDPPQWAELERQVLARPLTANELEEAASPIRQPNETVVNLMSALFLLVPAGATCVLAVLAARGPVETTVDLMVPLAIAVIWTGVCGVLPVSTTGIDRLWHASDVVASAVALAASAFALTVLLTGALPFSAWGALPGIAQATPWLVAAAAVGSLSAIVLLLTTRRFAPRLPRQRPSDLRPEQRAQWSARAAMLEELLKQGMVDRVGVDQPAMTEMPLGTWGTVDTQRRR